MTGLSLASTSFAHGGAIPRRHGYKHGNVSPQLSISGIPQGCASLALIMDDPDAMGAVGKVWVHWLVWNIPPRHPDFDESSVPEGCTEGLTDFNEAGYGGPAPPDRRHTYVFRLCALDSAIDLGRGATRQDLEDRMQDHIISETRLEGTFEP